MTFSSTDPTQSFEHFGRLTTHPWIRGTYYRLPQISPIQIRIEPIGATKLQDMRPPVRFSDYVAWTNQCLDMERWNLKKKELMSVDSPLNRRFNSHGEEIFLRNLL